jgi:aminoglycoside phosphotransferase (APT) family kinase protein
VPIASLPPLPVAPASVQWRQYRDVYDGFDWPHPVFELAFRWIEERLPDAESARETLVHGDFRHGNLMIGPDGVRGVLDWEISHRGDPLEDLGWLCVNSWRFGNIDLPVGGFGVREDLFAGYEAASGGARRSRARALLGGRRVAQVGHHVHDDALGVRARHRPLGGARGDRRRASEAEIDLLALIEGER